MVLAADCLQGTFAGGCVEPGRCLALCLVPPLLCALHPLPMPSICSCTNTYLRALFSCLKVSSNSG